MENRERNTSVGQEKNESGWLEDVSSEPSRKSGVGGIQSGESDKVSSSELKESEEEEEIEIPSEPGSNF
ncbi:MAG TPA: hypothetical protein VGS96_17060 [Thermoanaerobaculia bacterium]|jgi:hypothetical protein|nr:hypothetical protein [Thermoanaerobaculia bacterium]